MMKRCTKCKLEYRGSMAVNYCMDCGGVLEEVILKKFFITCTTDWSGTEAYFIVKAENSEQVEFRAIELSVENFNSYDNIWSEEKQINENAGLDWNEGDHYSHTIEEYNPQKHDVFEADITFL